MVKQKKQKEKGIICECSKCINRIVRDNKLHCGTMILDLNKPFSNYSKVTIKKDCPYFREKNNVQNPKPNIHKNSK